MERIYPVTQVTCSPYIGRTVCAIMHDGTQIVGTISGINERGLVLDRAVPGAQVLSTNPKKAHKQLSEIQRNAKTSAYGYGGGGYGGYGGYGYGYGLDWALIALLFTLPFFFI